MKTAVDSSVLFDIVKAAPGAAKAQAALETALMRGSLCVCAVVVAELGAAEAAIGVDSLGQSHLMRALLNTLVDRLAFADSRISRVIS